MIRLIIHGDRENKAYYTRRLGEVKKAYIHGGRVNKAYKRCLFTRLPGK